MIFSLFAIYSKLIGPIILGLFLGPRLPLIVINRLGKFLFWLGAPLSILVFLRRSDLSGLVWIAPVYAWIAILLGVSLALIWMRIENLCCLDSPLCLNQSTKGSFLLASMAGNTGYLGFPIVLTLVGEKYLGWAVFYDLLGSTLGSYGLGVFLVSHLKTKIRTNWQIVLVGLRNPALWSLGLGLLCRKIPLPELWELSLQAGAWIMIILSLILIGIRLSKLNSWRSLRLASISVVIKMLLVPLLVGITIFQLLAIPQLGLTDSSRLVIVLEAAMPPAFSTLLIAEAYYLDRELSVTAIVVGSSILLLTLPVWLLLFGVDLPM